MFVVAFVTVAVARLTHFVVRFLCFLVEDNALLPWNTHLSMPQGLDRTVQGKLLGMVSAGRAVCVR